MSTKTLEIGNLKPILPLIQGGMGVGISLSQLAGTVAKAGGIGIISSAQIGFKEPDFLTATCTANLRALQREIHAAKQLAPEGIIGVNIMTALTHYGETVKAAILAGAQLIISGAGLPLDLPLFAKGTDVKLVPIVSSAKAAHIICRMWDRKHQTCPDCLIVEGPLAGGHLGFKAEELVSPRPVLEIVKEVKAILSDYELKYDKKIPVVAAGGFYTGADVKAALLAGADGVQMGTRFVTTYECDAPISYKETYLQAQKEEIGIVKSPVGLPGRALLNDFVLHPPGNHACLYHCLEKCGVHTIPYCISKALIAAVTEDLPHALLFCGSNAYRTTHLEHVADILEEIKSSIISC